jgi:putative transcriptional regulator
VSESLAGRLLVATPKTGDVFDRSVVLVLGHSSEGAQGLILNKPLDAEVVAVLPEWQDHVVAPPQLYQGGPVGMDSAMGLAMLPEVGEDEAVVGVQMSLDGIGLVDLDAPPEIVTHQVSAVRIFVGYAGWSPGQLEAEIEEGAWYVVSREDSDPFWADASGLWRHVLLRQRNTLSLLTTYTSHPDHN